VGEIEMVRAHKNKTNSNKISKGMKKIYGYELIINLYGCHKQIISSKRKIQEYVDRLCKLIKMKKYGKTLIPYFGKNKIHTKGYSLVQLIETSSITGHFSDFWERAYINIFSCKKFNFQIAKKFTKEFFCAKKIKTKLLIR
jgi:S-adenosylmethionine/arginine decarboxylase-like enzyme